MSHYGLCLPTLDALQCRTAKWHNLYGKAVQNIEYVYMNNLEIPPNYVPNKSKNIFTHTQKKCTYINVHNKAIP